ncbi:MAG: carboxypeptidase regulatory-like domain-containing protein [Chloroflexi bacterium]|uniref:Carboxypeptidase regulatory-like domain-containing protein n=1 Tax=Candidatus Chlorohelix allophototropha TaxID=3003348 RepID=A0A8T7LUS9_9CHLR|nr:carboxypeptidase regulatory-like domain-containing protein [Chloroflexota bacterium]WJW66532.1 carboxypeptidase regulatory-like domain-containing protein [Chloroflexota bacterium L227-S17]
MMKETAAKTDTPTGANPLKSQGSLLVAILVAVVAFSLWLLLWHLFIGAAQWYALALSLTAVACFVPHPLLRNYPSPKKGLHILGWLCLFLSLATAFSLGAFLPFGFADIVSPALGKFGGLGALLVLLLLATTRAVLLRKSVYLDLAIFCGVGAIWVAINTEAQAAFPPPPTTVIQWENLLFSLFWLSLFLGSTAISLSLLPKARWVASSFWRWSLACSSSGFGLGFFFGQSEIAIFCGIALLIGLGLTSYFKLRHSTNKRLALIRQGLIQFGGIILIIFSLAIAFIAVSEQLEAVLLRNTLERYAQKGWWWAFGEDRFPEQRGLKIDPKPTGALTGLITDLQGKPIEGANVVLTDAAGFTFTTASGADGRYNLPGVQAGNYLPMVARAGYLDAVSTSNSPFGHWRMVATVRWNAITSNVDFVMQPREEYRIQPGNSLKLEDSTETYRDNPVPSPALRRIFSFENNGLTKSGIVYEPMPDKGAGPFPILLIVYPGAANAWEGVSIPLAAQGFVVIAYQPELFGEHPERGLNLRGDVNDMLQIYNYAKAGQFSTKGDPQRVVITGGSVSTVYTYLLLREIENSAPAEKAAVKGAIKYGGLADLYRYHYDWDRGALYIDPGIQDLESLLIAFGRPDLRPEIYMLFSPVYHLQQGSLPPLLVVHTSKDTIVPVIQTEILAQIMEKLNVQHKLLIYKDIEHYLDTSKRDPAQLDMLNQTIDFLKQVTN